MVEQHGWIAFATASVSKRLETATGAGAGVGATAGAMSRAGAADEAAAAGSTDTQPVSVEHSPFNASVCCA
jgi:hypothetical protein